MVHLDSSVLQPPPYSQQLLHTLSILEFLISSYNISWIDGVNNTIQIAITLLEIFPLVLIVLPLLMLVG